MSVKELEISLPFNMVREDTFSVEVVSFCGEKIRCLMPKVRPQIIAAGDYATLNAMQRALQNEEATLLECFVFLSKLFLVGFGPSRLDGYEQLYLDDLLRAVERHLKLACIMGLLAQTTSSNVVLDENCLVRS